MVTSKSTNFSIIPGFEPYSISDEGVLYCATTKKCRTAWVDSSTGYAYFRLAYTRSDGTKIMRQSRHRLMALAFLKCPGDPKDFVVNHKNGIKGDDRLDNLEWTTHQGNIEHAGLVGLTEKCIPISIRDVVTGKISKYPSATEAAKALELTKDSVLYRLRKGESFICPKGKQYRKGHSDKAWPVLGPEVLDFMRFGSARPTLIKDLRTGKVRYFKTVKEAADTIGLKLAALNNRLVKGDQRFIPGYFLAKRAEDKTPWRDVPDPYLLADKEGRQRPVVTIDRWGNRTIYDSAVECARALGLKSTTALFRLKSDGQIEYDGLRFRYYVDEVNSPLSSEMTK